MKFAVEESAEIYPDILPHCEGRLLQAKFHAKFHPICAACRGGKYGHEFSGFVCRSSRPFLFPSLPFTLSSLLFPFRPFSLLSSYSLPGFHLHLCSPPISSPLLPSHFPSSSFLPPYVLSQNLKIWHVAILPVLKRLGDRCLRFLVRPA